MKNLKMHIDGFTIIEVLLALSILCICSTLIVLSLPALQKSLAISIQLEDEIGLRQVRRVLLLSDSIITTDHVLYFYYLGEDTTLELEDDKLIKRDGYVLYLDHLDKSYFSENDSCIYLNYEKENKTYKRLLVCQ